MTRQIEVYLALLAFLGAILGTLIVGSWRRPERPAETLLTIRPFTSRRERRLWFWALVVMAAIYSTLGPAQMLAQALRERNLLRLSFAVGLVLIGTILAWRWIKQRPGQLEIGVAVCVAAAYLMTFFRAASPEERTHLFEYGLVAVLIHQAFEERVRNGRRVPVPALITLAVTALLGWLDEGIQSLLPNRAYDLRDVGVNALAGLMATAASVALARARRWDALRRRRRGPRSCRW